jgi:hypothetical protein
VADYTASPVTYDHALVIGDTYQPATVTLTDGDGVPHALTGVTGTCEVRETIGGVVLLSPTVTIISPAANGQFSWSSLPAATALLSPGTARYAIRLTWPSGVVRTVLEGQITIRRTVLA